MADEKVPLSEDSIRSATLKLRAFIQSLRIFEMQFIVGTHAAEGPDWAAWDGVVHFVDMSYRRLDFPVDAGDPYRRPYPVKFRGWYESSFHKVALEYLSSFWSEMFVFSGEPGGDEPHETFHVTEFKWTDEGSFPDGLPREVAWSRVAESAGKDSYWHTIIDDESSGGAGDYRLPWAAIGRINWRRLEVGMEIEIEDAIERVSRGRQYYKPPATKRVTYSRDHRSIRVDGRVVADSLSPQHFEFMRSLIDAYPDPISFKQIRSKSEVFTASVNQTRLVERLPQSLAAMVESLHGRGYKLNLPSDTHL